MATKQKNKRNLSATSPKQGLESGSGLVGRWWFPACIILVVACLFYAPFLFSDEMLSCSDQITSLDSKVLYQNELHHFRFPLWTSTRLSGMPTVDAMFGDAFYPVNVVFNFLFSVPRLIGYKIFLHVFLAGLFASLMFEKGFRLERRIALLGGLLYMLNAEFVSHTYPGHDGKMYVISLLPLCIWMLERLIEKPTLRNSALFGLPIGLSLLTSHIQMTYFVLWGLFAYMVFRVVFIIRDKKAVRPAVPVFSFFWVGVALGLGLGMIQFLAPYMFVQEGLSVRGPEKGFEYAASWSLHPEEAASLWVPEFGNTLENYWGRNYFKLNTEYVGLVSTMLFVFSLIVLADRTKLFWMGAGLFGLFYSLGAHTPLFRLCYELIPGVKSFRGPSMLMLWFAFGLVMVAATGLSQVLKESPAWPHERKERIIKRLLYAAGGVLGLCVVLSIAGDAVQSIWRSIFYGDMTAEKAQIMAANYPNFVKGLWIWGVLTAGSLFVLRMYVQGQLKAATLVSILAVVAVIDLWRVDSRFIQVQDPSEYTTPDAAIMQVRRDPEPKRVFDLPGSYNQNFVGNFGLESVGGFHDNELKWYRAFRGENSANLVEQLQRGNVEGNPFLNLLNTKYLLYRPGRGQAVSVIPNPGALPRVFLADRFEILPESLAVQRLKDPGFDYRRVLLLEKKPEGYTPSADSTSAGTTVYRKVSSNRFQVQVAASRSSLLFVSEVFYPGWQAAINGARSEIYRADGALMAVVVPAGKSTVDFTIHSRYLKIGTAVSAVSLVLLLGILFVPGLKRHDDL